MNQVPCTAYIRDNATGETVEHASSCNPNPDGTPNPFWWQRGMGNAGCDCNRKQFFWEEKGVDLYENVARNEGGYEIADDEIDPCPCGHEAFSVNLAAEDGHVFYREFEDEKP